MLSYDCTNDDCPTGRVLVARDTDAVCPKCGWMLTATYPERPEGLV